VAPDSWEIEESLLAMLQNDTTLKALAPDGVWIDLAAAGAKRFVIVSLIDPTDRGKFGGRAIEDNRYLVKAVGLSTVMSGSQIRQAAYRIDQLIHDQVMTIDGYTFMDMARDENESRIRVRRADERDPGLTWLEGGAWYRIRVSIP
jgi:hypothetical protein